MTNSSHRTPGQRRKNFNADFNAREDDFILADLQIIPDDTKLKITPLQHWLDDEDAIDRLLVNTGFETNTEERQSDELIVENISSSDEWPEFDRFRYQNDAIDAIQPAIAPLRHWSDDEGAIDKLLVNTGFETDAKAKQPDELMLKGISLPDKQPDSDPFNQHDPMIAFATADPGSSQTTPATVPVSTKNFQVENFISTCLAMRPDARIAETETDDHINGREHTATLNQAPERQKEARETVRPHTDRPATITESTSKNIASAEESVTEPATATHVSVIPKATIFHGSGKNRNPNPGNKTGQITTIVFAALAFAMGALIIATITLAMMVSEMKAEIVRLTELLEIVKDDMGALDEKSSLTTHARSNASQN